MVRGLIDLVKVRKIKEYQINSHGNNFNAVRLVLASGVILTHSFSAIHKTKNVDDISGVFGVPISYLAVNGFFFVSGFLVCRSLFRQNGFLQFSALRIARIWPGLAVSIFFTIIAFAIISENFISYIFEMETAIFILKNITQLFAHYTLPGIYSTKDIIHVNESLWTIPWEIRCYAVISMAYIIPEYIRKNFVIYILSASLITCVLWIFYRNTYGKDLDVSHGFWFYIEIWSRLWGCFSSGALASLFIGRVILSIPLMIVLWVLAIIEYSIFNTSLMASLACFYTVMVAAFWQDATRAFSSTWHDLSYGVYIYAFPIMVIINLFWMTDSFRMLALATFALTIPVAAASWLVVERPALQWTKRGISLSGKRG